MNTMKKILLIFIFVFILGNICFAKDYAKIYSDLPNIKVQYIESEDPDEYYDVKDYYFSPYPLLRITRPMYVCDLTIEPGFYLLTPREYNGQKVVLFKDNGKVKYVVPVFEYEPVLVEKEYVKPKKKWYQIRDRYTFQAPYYEQKMQVYDADTDNRYTIIDLYYRSGRYKTIYKKEKP